MQIEVVKRSKGFALELVPNDGGIFIVEDSGVQRIGSKLRVHGIGASNALALEVGEISIEGRYIQSDAKELGRFVLLGNTNTLLSWPAGPNNERSITFGSHALVTEFALLQPTPK